MNEHRKLLEKVQMADFALQESALFLDIHTKDKEALAYFRHYQKSAKEAKEEYERKFGPLQYQNQKNADYWQWTKGPWPWECEE